MADVLDKMLLELPRLLGLVPGNGQHVVGALDPVVGFIQRLERALQLGLPTPELHAEAVRVRAVALFAIGKLEDARAGFAKLAQLCEQAPGLGYAVEAADWLERIRFMQRRK